MQPTGGRVMDIEGLDATARVIGFGAAALIIGGLALIASGPAVRARALHLGLAICFTFTQWVGDEVMPQRDNTTLAWSAIGAFALMSMAIAIVDPPRPQCDGSWGWALRHAANAMACLAMTAMIYPGPDEGSARVWFCATLSVIAALEAAGAVLDVRRYRRRPALP